MMVETILESSQDFGMSNGALPQWKRELLQRRAARGRPAPAPALAPAAPPPLPPPLPQPPCDEDDEELRYGPGIVKRLKSRYLSLALRDAPRRRPSVLRRAASLEHLIEERPPAAPRPARAPRPASVAAPPSYPRRDLVKRARSVDALSRLEEAPSPPPPPPAPPRGPAAIQTRAPRPPRRPGPLLRDTERPPPDLVRSTLRKFESAPSRRPAPAARVSAVLRGLEPQHRTVTPEREPSPAPPPTPPPPPPLPATPPPAPPALAALTPKIKICPSPLIDSSRMTAAPPRCPSPVPVPTPVTIAPRETSPVSPVTPSPPRPAARPAPEVRPDSAPKEDEFGSTVVSDEVEIDAVPVLPVSSTGATATATRRVSRAALEGIARAGSSVRYAFEASRGGGAAGSHLPPLGAANPVLVARRVGVIRPMPAVPAPRSLPNGHQHKHRTSPPPPPPPPAATPAPDRPPWARAAPRPRAPPSQATSIVFNFSSRKDVPDYIENDGIVLRGSRRPYIKAGESGVVRLKGVSVNQTGEEESGSDGEEEGEGEGLDGPVRVRFVNDNVLINGRSSMPARPDRQRQAKLKLQFDDSLTRTHEYPSETSLVADDSPPASTPDAPAPTLADNTHIASAALSRYAPSKTRAAAAPLGLAPQHVALTTTTQTVEDGGEGEDEDEGEQWEAAPAPAPAPWSAARALATDMLF